MKFLFYKKNLFIILVLSMGLFLNVYHPNVFKNIYNQITHVFQLLPNLSLAGDATPLEIELTAINQEDESIQNDKTLLDTSGENASQKKLLHNYDEFSEINSKNILSIINKERNERGLRSLAFDYELNISAQKKSQDMLSNAYFAHTRLDGKPFTYFIDYAGYDYIKTSENLARGNFTTSSEIVEAWMNSIGHRQNILDSTMVDTGIGIVFGEYKGSDTYFITQHFGRPRGTCPIIEKYLEPEIRINNLKGKALYAEIKTLQKTIDEILNNNPSEQDRLQVKELEKSLDTKITEYNSIVDSVQSLTLIYNTQVKAFNECNATYYSR